MTENEAPEIEDQDEVESEDEINEEIIALARERFDIAVEGWRDIFKAAKADLEFCAGVQWDEQDLKSRASDGRPSLTINRMPQFKRQVANDIRQNPIGINVSPVDSAADIETAKIFKGLIRHIEYASDADTAYDRASDSSVGCGIGFFRIITEFSDPMSFVQDIRVKSVADRFSVLMDPTFTEPDGSDSNYAFIEERIPKEAYKSLYPDSEISKQPDFKALSKECGDWVDDASVRVTEYFYREWVPEEIVLLSKRDPMTGETSTEVVLASEVDEQMMAVMGVQIQDRRSTLLPKVKWAKINGLEVLEKKEWAGRWIPIIPVLGEEMIIEGKRTLAGLIRHAKDSQKMYNYSASCEVEAIALAPKAPWVGYAGQFDGHEEEWSQANRKSFAYLEVNPTMINGQAAPLPQRNSFEPALQGISNMRALAGEDLKATTGIYDAGLGAQSNEKSGIAIQRRASQSQTSNFHFVDNLSKSIRHCGRQLIDLIPKIYDTPRAVRTLGEDGTEDVVRINEVFKKEDGKEYHYDLSAGKYDVTISTGPSYETKRQEATSSMLELARSMPQMMQAGADIIVKNMDFQGSDEVAKRIAKSMPPGLVDDQKGPQALPPQVQQQMKQQSDMISQLSKELEARTEQMKEKTLEYEHKERMQARQLESDAAIELARLQSKEAIIELGHMVSRASDAQSALQAQMTEMDALSKQPSAFNQLQNAPQEMSQGPAMGQEPSQEMPDQQQFTGELPPASMETP